MTELYTTFSLCKAAHACQPSVRKMAEHLGGIETYGRDTPFTVLQVLNVCGLDDALWVLAHAMPTDQRSAAERSQREFACDCAERVLPVFEARHPDDMRPRKAITTSQRFVRGEATVDEVSDARAAAAYAALAAADAYANDAAYAAVRASAYDISHDAARAAAYAAAARADAHVGERQWQTQRLRELLEQGVE